jgi:hypothetical protein
VPNGSQVLIRSHFEKDRVPFTVKLLKTPSTSNMSYSVFVIFEPFVNAALLSSEVTNRIMSVLDTGRLRLVIGHSCIVDRETSFDQ